MEVLEGISSSDLEDVSQEHIKIGFTPFLDSNLSYEEIGVLLCLLCEDNFTMVKSLKNKENRKGIGPERFRNIVRKIEKLGYAKMERINYGGRGAGFYVNWSFSCEKEFLTDRETQ
jgi:hypothetical protein